MGTPVRLSSLVRRSLYVAVGSTRRERPASTAVFCGFRCRASDRGRPSKRRLEERDEASPRPVFPVKPRRGWCVQEFVVSALAHVFGGGGPADSWPSSALDNQAPRHSV